MENHVNGAHRMIIIMELNVKESNILILLARSYTLSCDLGNPVTIVGPTGPQDHFDIPFWYLNYYTLTSA